jgi:Ca-activated chloride channel family protein
MKTPLARQTCRQRLFAKPIGLWLLASLLLVAAGPAQNDRPPWARKSKTAGGSTATNEAASDPLQDRAKIKVKVDLVSVLVSVLDEHNRPAPDLPIEAFRLFDEENPQTIAVFEKETQQPLDLVLMFDASLSTQLGQPAQREAASRFIQQVLRPGDRLAVYAVDENVTQIAAFSDNVARLQDAIKRIPQGAGTSIYDAVFLGSKALARQGTERRSVIILITDGGETTSHADFDTARREAVRNGTLLYTVVIRAMKNESGRNTAGEHALETITDTTGGAVFYPDGTAQLGEIFDRINRELRTQYRLGYYPTPRGPADTYRSIEVRVVPPATQEALAADSGSSEQPGNYAVRHRKSYYTGQP